jgi:hypothetical protein
MKYAVEMGSFHKYWFPIWKLIRMEIAKVYFRKVGQKINKVLKSFYFHVM